MIISDEWWLLWDNWWLTIITDLKQTDTQSTDYKFIESFYNITIDLWDFDSDLGSAEEAGTEPRACLCTTRLSSIHSQKFQPYFE